MIRRLFDYVCVFVHGVCVHLCIFVGCMFVWCKCVFACVCVTCFVSFVGVSFLVLFRCCEFSAFFLLLLLLAFFQSSILFLVVCCAPFGMNSFGSIGLFLPHVNKLFPSFYISS